jgi:hypothetical protein
VWRKGDMGWEERMREGREEEEDGKESKWTERDRGLRRKERGGKKKGTEVGKILDPSLQNSATFLAYIRYKWWVLEHLKGILGHCIDCKIPINVVKNCIA